MIFSIFGAVYRKTFDMNDVISIAGGLLNENISKVIEYIGSQRCNFVSM